MTYAEKLKDPRWQKMRLRIFERDEFTCRYCGDVESTLHIHHKIYRNNCDPWEYEESDLITLCEECHSEEREQISKTVKALIDAVKRNFFSGDILNIAIGFDAIKFPSPYVPEVIASIISWVLQDENIMQELSDRYFDNLKEKRIKAEARRREFNNV